MTEFDDSNYTSICSSITIQSEGKGFFNEFYECVRESCGDQWIQNEYKKLPSEREKLLAMFDDPNVCGIVMGTLEHVKPVFKGKDAKFSMQRRIQGDELMKTRDLRGALMMYSVAVIRAPPPGENKMIDSGLTLALALWNRSKVLIELNDGEKALQDLQYAVKNNFPVKHEPEYYWRLGKSYSQIGEIVKSRVSFGLAEKLLNGNEESLILLKEDLQIAEECAEENKLQKESKIKKLPELKDGENRSLPSASNLLQIATNQSGSDRYVIAANNINTGDTVLVENPVGSSLFPKYFGTHCYECFVRLEAPIGCSDCSGVAFCSVECKEKAQSYHKYECKYLDLLIGSGMSVLCHVALKMILQTENNDKKLAEVKETLNNLCTHSEKRGSHDYLQRSLMTSFLLRFLQHCGFFGRRTTEAVDPNKKELEVGVLLLGLLQALQFNAHEIYETKLGENHRILGSAPIHIAVGIYKTGSLFNHDCCPGVARYFIGKTIIYSTTRPLKYGDLVSENYGPIFTKKNLKERRRILKSRYWFTCECKACMENWPILDELPETPKFKCPTINCTNILIHPTKSNKDIKCLKCKQKVNLSETIAFYLKSKELYIKGAELMDEQKTKEAIPVFCEAIDLFYQLAVPPHKDTHVAQQSLRVCFGDQGTTYKPI